MTKHHHYTGGIIRISTAFHPKNIEAVLRDDLDECALHLDGDVLQICRPDGEPMVSLDFLEADAPAREREDFELKLEELCVIAALNRRELGRAVKRLADAGIYYRWRLTSPASEPDEFLLRVKPVDRERAIEVLVNEGV